MYCLQLHSTPLHSTDVPDAIKEMERQTLIAGLNVIVPFYKGRRGCSPADPQLFAGASLARPTALAIASIVIAVAALMQVEWR